MQRAPHDARFGDELLLVGRRPGVARVLPREPLGTFRTLQDDVSEDRRHDELLCLLLERGAQQLKSEAQKRRRAHQKYSRRRRRRRRRRSVFMMAHPRCYYSYALHRLSISLRASERRSGPARPFCCCKVETSSHARGHQGLTVRRRLDPSVDRRRGSFKSGTGGSTTISRRRR